MNRQHPHHSGAPSVTLAAGPETSGIRDGMSYRRLLHSTTDRTLMVPQTHNRFADRRFAVAAPRLCNSLTTSLKFTDSLGDILKLIYLGFEKSQHSAV